MSIKQLIHKYEDGTITYQEQTVLINELYMRLQCTFGAFIGAILVLACWAIWG